jgi:hypothetical protein
MWTHWKEFSQIVAQSHTQSERVNNLQRVVSSSPEQHNKLISGMLFGILIAPTIAGPGQGRPQQGNPLMPCEAIFADMRSIVRDHF